MAQSQYNVRQRTARLNREVAHFARQSAKFILDRSPQGKRCFTRAVRCLNRRLTDLEKVEGLLN